MWNVKKLFRTENQPDAEPPVWFGIRLMGSILLWIERPHTARDTLLLPIPPSLPPLQAGFSEGKGGRREGVMDGRADGSAWHRFVTSSHQLLHPSSSSVKRFQSGKDSLQSGAPLPKDGTQNRSLNKKWGRQFLVFRWGGTLGLMQLTMELSRLRCKRLSWNLFQIWSQPVGLQVFSFF